MKKYNRTKIKATKMLDDEKLVHVDKDTWVQVAKDIPDRQVREKYVLKKLENLHKLTNPPKSVDFFR